MASEEKSSGILRCEAVNGSSVRPKSGSEEPDLTFSTLTDQENAALQNGSANAAGARPDHLSDRRQPELCTRTECRGATITAGLRPEAEARPGHIGEVWLAEDRLTQRMVAVKFLHHGKGRNWGPCLTRSGGWPNLIATLASSTCSPLTPRAILRAT